MMEKTRNKRWREAKRQALYRRQLKLHSAWGWNNPDGTITHDWNRLKAEKGLQVYKSVRCPCSCPICKGERYDRRSEKRLEARLLKEHFEE